MYFSNISGNYFWESDGSPVNLLGFKLEFLDAEFIENITAFVKNTSVVSSSSKVISVQLPEIDLVWQS